MYIAAFIRLLQLKLPKPNSCLDIQQKTFIENCCYFSYYFFQQSVLTNCELSTTLHTVDLTVKNLHGILSVYQLSPAWLVSPQALSAGIAVPGHETRHLLQAPLVLHAFGDLEVAGCTFHKEEHQSCKHQPNNNALFE